MFGFDEARKERDDMYDGNHQARDDMYDGNHQAKFGHEALAGGIAFEAMRKWEDSQRQKGVAVNHSMAKDVLMGFAGAETDKWAESKGMDKLSHERAKHQAKEQAEHLYDEQYGNSDQYDPNQSSRHQTMDF